MPVTLGEYHPHAACLMYRGCGDEEQVRHALNVVRWQWYGMGKREVLGHD